MERAWETTRAPTVRLGEVIGSLRDRTVVFVTTRGNPLVAVSRWPFLAVSFRRRPLFPGVATDLRATC